MRDDVSALLGDELNIEPFEIETTVKSDRCCEWNATNYHAALLCLLNIFLFADQNLLAPNLTEIANEFGLSPVERDRKLGGDIALAFFAVGAASSLFFGYLGDSVNRIIALACVVFAGELACLCTYWVTTYNQLIALRALTGISIGGSVPLVYSLFGDMYGNSNRGLITSLAGVAMGFGVGMGQIIAGLTSPWRIPFLIIPPPAFIVAVLLVTTTTEPKRGVQEEVLSDESGKADFHYAEKINAHKLKRLLQSPSFMLLLAQGLPGSLPWGTMIVYFNDFLSQELGFTVQQSTLIVLCYGIGIIVGQLSSGYLVDSWFRHHKKLIALFIGSCTILGAVPVIFLLYLPRKELWVYCITCLPSGAIAGVSGAAIRTLLLNITVPETRGTAFALLNVVDDIGRGLGPFFVSLIIQALPDNRREALVLSMSGWLVCGMFLMSLAFTLERDVYKAEEHTLEAYLAKSGLLGDRLRTRILQNGEENLVME